MSWFRKNLSTIFLFFALFAGLGLLLYPTFSDYWNSLHQSRAIAGYAEQVSQIEDIDYAQLLQEAEAYNKSLLEKEGTRYLLTDEEREEYESLLNISGNGVMGYINIPKINISLPVYHGVDESVLQVAVGHIEGTSLPVGGKGSHSVLSGHRGLPSARLFTDLDELEKGDIFFLMILDETLSYEVDQIRIVLPTELSDLEIDEEKDLCTLVTCTPYGINTHRLLVRGHRVENPEEQPVVRVSADAFVIDPVMVAPLAAVLLILLLLLLLLISSRKGTLHGRALRKAREEQRELEAAYEERNE